MPCYHPLDAYEHKYKVNSKTGKPIVVVTGKFGKPPSHINDWKLIHVGCGQCIGCRLNRARQWGVRGMHEAQMHKDSCFLTLTYDDEHVPWSSDSGEQTLVGKDLQDFMKRLRDKLGYIPLRYISCGEYGEETHRPHYHMLLYGFNPDDKFLYKISGRGDKYYNSPFLDSVWKHGHVVIGDVNFRTCAYVGRYVTKKLNGEQGEIEYEYKQKPFIHASNRPGIGATWFDKYYTDIYPYDECVVDLDGNKRIIPPPEYYDDLYERIDPEGMKEIKMRRRKKAEKFEDQVFTDRLTFKELYKLKTLENIRREIENG